MADDQHYRFLLPDRTYQSIVRSELRKLAVSANFKGHRLGEIELIIAEITSNLVIHATNGGMILARPMHDKRGGFEIIAIDNGPGMSQPLKMMEDGQTSKRSLGQGLGAIRRLSDVFDLYSLAGWGTVVYSRCYATRKDSEPAGRFVVNGISVSKKEEMRCGDVWGIRETDKFIKIIMIDGLGHGILAHDAAVAGVLAVQHHLPATPSDELRTIHGALKKTRGGVATITHIDKRNNQLVYAGIGNISMKVLSRGTVKGCFSFNGIVGHILPSSLDNHSLLWNEKTDVLVMHSDGITARWDMQKYPGIMHHHNMIIAAAIYKDHDRGSDDCMIIVGKMTKAF